MEIIIILLLLYSAYLHLSIMETDKNVLKALELQCKLTEFSSNGINFLTNELQKIQDREIKRLKTEIKQLEERN